jgi:hypothetical protein
MTDSQFSEIRYALAHICAILLMDKMPDKNSYTPGNTDIPYSQDLQVMGDFLKDSTNLILQIFEKNSRQSGHK